MKPSDFNLTFLDSTHSTQDYVRHELEAGNLSGSGAVLAGMQTAGRGRGTRQWHSTMNLGLWTTLFLESMPGTAFDTVVRTSLAVVDTLRFFDLKTAIKWPNDVIVGRKKICGILTETFGNHLLVGVGVNLRHEQNDFPEALQPIATSLFLETGNAPDPRTFFSGFLERFCANSIPDENFVRYDSLFGLKNEVMRINNETIRVVGVARNGALMTWTKENGEVLQYSGTLTWKESCKK